MVVVGLLRISHSVAVVVAVVILRINYSVVVAVAFRVAVVVAPLF